MAEELKKYWQKVETDEEERIGVYVSEDGKKYTLSWGHDISTLADDGKTILHNEEIEGVIQADSEEEAAEKFDLKKA